MKDSERAAFLVAFQEVLKPLMRIGRHYGLSGHDLWDSFAQSSVEFEAERINRTEQRSASPARVAMFTGLNKNEVVSRLAQQGLAAKNYARRAQVLSEILNAWHTQQGYAAVYDLAREIPFDDERGRASFVALCDQIAPEFDPQALLDDLFESSCIERLEGGYLRPVTRAYVLPPGDVARLDRMGKVLLNFSEAFATSLVGDSGRFASFSERTLITDFALSNPGAAIFNSEVRIRGTKLLTDLDSWLSTQAPRVSAEEGPRFGCGLYVFEDIASVGRARIEVEEEPDEISSDSSAGAVNEEFVLDVLNHPLSKLEG